MLVYNPDMLVNNVIIVGCGGTGSRVVPLIAQMVSSQEWIPDPWITLVDDDVVEDKNLARQNFIKPDLDRPKAQVLAERYSNAFGINILPLVMRVNPSDSIFSEIVRARSSSGSHGSHRDMIRNRMDCVVIMCVDSPESRRNIIANMVNSHPNPDRILFVDAGNEDTFGQVRLFHGSLPILDYSKKQLDSLPERLMFEHEIPLIPIPSRAYAYMEAGEGTGSCADLDQTMAINNLMAATIVGVFQNILYAQPIRYREVSVDLNGASNTQWLDNNWFKSIPDKEGEYFITSADSAELSDKIPSPLLGNSYRKGNCSKFVYGDFVNSINAKHKVVMEGITADSA